MHDFIIELQKTVEHLLSQQEVLSVISEKKTFSLEKDLLSKTQESLFAHLNFLIDMYPSYQKEVKIKEKDEIDSKIRALYLSKGMSLPSHIKTFLTKKRSVQHLRKSRFSKTKTEK